MVVGVLEVEVKKVEALKERPRWTSEISPTKG